jgi:hypothetical protein
MTAQPSPAGTIVKATTDTAARPDPAFADFTVAGGSALRIAPFRWTAPEAAGVRFEPDLGIFRELDATGGAGAELGTVSVWEPGERLVFSYTDAELPDATEVEVRFRESGGVTVVDLEHRGWEALPEDGREAAMARKAAQWAALLRLLWGRPSAPVGVTPRLRYKDVPGALGWLTTTLGFRERATATVDGAVVYARVERGPVLVELSAAGSTPVADGPEPVHLTVAEELPSGSFTAYDPEGRAWTLAEAVQPAPRREQTAAAALGRLTDVITPFAVRTAVSLDLARLISSGTTRLDALAREAGADADALRRLLRHLCGAGVFAEPEPGRYELTDVSRQLQAEESEWFRAWMRLDGPGARMDLAFAGLLHSIRTGEAGYPAVHGRSLWADMKEDTELNDFFNDITAAHAWQTAPLVAKEYDWSTARRVLDVGGGPAALLSAVLLANPHLHGAVLDMATVVPGARRTIADTGLADRAEAVEGSFFEPLPTGYDVYVVSRVLTDWNDESATTILRRCADAARPGGGKVLIVEVLPGEEHERLNTSFDLHMLALLGGRERTLGDFAAIGARAGLTVSGTRSWDTGLTVIELVPAAR